MKSMDRAERMKRTEKTGTIRKMGKIRRAAVLACVLAAVMCTGCGGADGMSMDQAAPDNRYMGGSASSTNGSYDIKTESAVIGSEDAGWAPSEPGAGAGNTDVTVDTDRKLIKTVNLSVETKEFEQAVAALETQIRQLGGYIEKLETYNGSRYSSGRSTRYSNMTVRIPRENLNIFLETVSGVCNVVRRNDTLNDVTLSYVDIESRRNALRTEQERLLSFLEKAKTVEEIIALEERLSDVRYQLESMEARLRTIDNQVDFSTVHLDISEVMELTPVKEQTVWERLVDGFRGSLGDVGDGFVDFVVWFVVNIPYFVIWAAVIAVAVVIIRKAHRRKKEKLLAKAAKADAQWKAAGENAGNRTEGREVNDASQK